jgi:hypothetical protein
MPAFRPPINGKLVGEGTGGLAFAARPHDSRITAFLALRSQAQVPVKARDRVSHILLADPCPIALAVTVGKEAPLLGVGSVRSRVAVRPATRLTRIQPAQGWSMGARPSAGESRSLPLLDGGPGAGPGGSGDALPPEAQGRSGSEPWGWRQPRGARPGSPTGARGSMPSSASGRGFHRGRHAPLGKIVRPVRSAKLCFACSTSTHLAGSRDQRF